MYSYTGTYQTFTVPFDGTYTIQCWGASGGTDSKTTNTNYLGRGGYTYGEIDLKKDEIYYIYIGGKGITNQSGSWRSGPVANTGGYNGGGNTSPSGNSGGGATDIRIVVDDLYSRIMVAGGGGGMNCYSTTSEGGDAGGLYGPLFNGRTHNGTDINKGGTQDSGGIAVTSKNGYPGNNGTFGTGGNGYFGGGGGGWYGGSGGSDQPFGQGGEIGAGGGSSFVSGFTGCKAHSSYKDVSDNSVVKYNNKIYKFNNAEIWDGTGYKWNSSSATGTRGFPTPDASGTENGHSEHGDNGYCKITCNL